MRVRPAKAALGRGKQNREEALGLKGVTRIGGDGDRIAADVVIGRGEAKITAKADGDLDGVMGVEVGAAARRGGGRGIDHPKGAAFPNDDAGVCQNLHDPDNMAGAGCCQPRPSMWCCVAPNTVQGRVSAL